MARDAIRRRCSRCSSAACRLFSARSRPATARTDRARRRSAAAAALRGAPTNPAEARAGDWVIARLLRYPQRRRAGRGAHRAAPRSGAAGGDGHRGGDRALRAAGGVLGRGAARGGSAGARASIRPRPRERVDLRALPLVTIDGEDAQGFRRCGVRRAARRAAAFACWSRSPMSATTCGRAARSTRGARARHLGLFPDSRATDAADGAVEPSVLARAARGPAVHGRGHAASPGAVRSSSSALLSGGDALGGAPHLHARRTRRCSLACRRRARRSASAARGAAAAGGRLSCARGRAPPARQRSTSMRRRRNS